MKKELLVFVFCVCSVLSAQKESPISVNKGIFLSSNGKNVTLTFNKSSHEQMINDTSFNNTRINNTDHTETQLSQNFTQNTALNKDTEMIKDN